MYNVDYSIPTKSKITRHSLISTTGIPINCVTMSKVISRDKLSDTWKETAILLGANVNISLLDIINEHMVKINEPKFTTLEDIPDYMSTHLDGKPLSWAIERNRKGISISFQVKINDIKTEVNEFGKEKVIKTKTKQYEMMSKWGFTVDRLFSRETPPLLTEEEKIALEISTEELEEIEHGYTGEY